MRELDAAIKHAIKNPEFTLYKLKNAASKFSFLLVPISLPFLWLMFFWKRGVTMYDHAVFTLYSLSFMALLVVMLSLLKMAGLKSLVACAGVSSRRRCTCSCSCAAPTRWASARRCGARWRCCACPATVFVLYLLLILMMSVAG